MRITIRNSFVNIIYKKWLSVYRNASWRDITVLSDFHSWLYRVNPLVLLVHCPISRFLASWIKKKKTRSPSSWLVAVDVVWEMLLVKVQPSRHHMQYHDSLYDKQRKHIESWLTLLRCSSSFIFRHRTFTVSGRTLPRFITCPITSIPHCDIAGLYAWWVSRKNGSLFFVIFCHSLIRHAPEDVTKGNYSSSSTDGSAVAQTVA